MTIKTKEGDILGSYSEFLNMGGEENGSISISEASIPMLKKEIKRRQQILPFIDYANLVIERGKSRNIEIDNERLIFELHYDVLRRPEMFFGYKVSALGLEEIMEEDQKISQGIIPPRNKNEGRIIWTDRLVIYKRKELLVAPYATDGSPEVRERSISDLLDKIDIRLKNNVLF